MCYIHSPLIQVSIVLVTPAQNSATYKLCVLEKVNKPLCAFVFSVKGEFSTTKIVLKSYMFVLVKPLDQGWLIISPQ